MTRDGDKILFGSDGERKRFEEALLRQRGAERFVDLMFQAVAQAERDAQEHWEEAARHIDRHREELIYDWPGGHVRVRPLSGEFGDRPEE